MILLVTVLVALCAEAIGYSPYSNFLSRPIPRFAEKLKGQDLADYINLVQPFFTAEPSELSEEEQRALIMDLEFLPPEPNERAEEIPDNVDIPESFDAREAWPQCRSIKIVRDQATCGSCWAVASASTMSDRLCVQSNGTIQTLVSDADIAFCCQSCGRGCHGGHGHKAWQYAKQNGVCSGGLYGTKDVCKPYPIRRGVKPDTSCKKECQSGYNKTFEEDKIYAKEFHWVKRNVESIQKEIMLNGPVLAIFTVFSDLFQYTSGVYVHTGGINIGAHSVKIIGWGVENNNVPYWIIANSWGTAFRDKGHFKMIRGVNNCLIENYVLAGTMV